MEGSTNIKNEINAILFISFLVKNIKDFGLNLRFSKNNSHAAKSDILQRLPAFR